MKVEMQIQDENHRGHHILRASLGSLHPLAWFPILHFQPQKANIAWNPRIHPTNQPTIVDKECITLWLSLASWTSFAIREFDERDAFGDIHSACHRRQSCNHDHKSSCLFLSSFVRSLALSLSLSPLLIYSSLFQVPSLSSLSSN